MNTCLPARRGSSIYIKAVIAVKGEGNLVRNEWNKELHKYISCIIKGKYKKYIIVNGMLTLEKKIPEAAKECNRITG